MASSYEIPAFGSTGDTILGWMNEAVAEGNIWLGAQKPTQEWQSVMDVLGPMYAGGPNAVVGQSNTGYNLVRHAFKEVRATLSNFKHAGEFVPTEDNSTEMYDRAHLLTNLDRHWERVTFANLQYRDSLSYALGKGTGYTYIDWDRSRWGPGRGDIRLRAFDPADITFVQLPKTYDIQQAYVVLIREVLPLNLAKRIYAWNPVFANALVADGDGTNWIQKGKDRVQQFLSPFLRAGGSGRKENESFPTVQVWTAYTLDGSINTRTEKVTMGAYGTNWSYTVPALGDPMGQGVTNPRTGSEWTLPAQPEDCMLFPLRRMTLFSRTAIGYDGSSPWWHGAVPVSRTRFNDMPWEALGASQVGDATTMQVGIVELMRLIEDAAAARLDPPAGYDENRVDKAAAEAINPRKAGVRFPYDATLGMPIEYPFPPQYYDVPSWIAGEGGFIRQQEERIKYITSATDMTAVAKARQIPSADTMEKLMEMAGPIVQDMTGALIQPQTEMGEYRKALFFQFYTRQRMIRVADPEMTELLTDVKYLPEKLIPLRSDETLAALAARTRAYLSDFRFEVTESGISEMTRMSRQLLYIQLAKSGVLPISWWTMAKIARVPNYGPTPVGTNTEMERVLAQRRIEMELAAEAAGAMEPQLHAGPGGASGNGGGEGPGRPASFNKPPRIVNKDGGTRSTIVTS